MKMRLPIENLAIILANSAHSQGSECPCDCDYAKLSTLIGHYPTKKEKAVFDRAFRDQARENEYNPIDKFGHEWPTTICGCVDPRK
jgi:hypothetical protein